MSFAPTGLNSLRDAVIYRCGEDQFLGIVGDTAHTSGYHLGRDRIYGPSGKGAADYSVKTDRDRAGLTDAASAIDIGMDWTDCRDWLSWLIERCRAGVYPDIREIIGSVDGKSAQRYDSQDGWTKREGASRDHITHTHLSFFRDAGYRDQSPVINDYQGDDMDQATFESYLKNSEIGIPWQPGFPGTGPGPRGGIRVADIMGWSVYKLTEMNTRLMGLEEAGAAPGGGVSDKELAEAYRAAADSLES